MKEAAPHVMCRAAEGAVVALFARRSPNLGLVGKHIDSTSGLWTETDSGIGGGGRRGGGGVELAGGVGMGLSTNGDSYYEYLLKMYVLWGDVRYWDMFMQSYVALQRFAREGDWYAGVDMSGGFVTSRKFDNLMAFWPGMQTLVGDVSLASRTLNAFFQIWRDWGFLPEQFNHSRWTLEGEGSGKAYPLRPELIESTLLLHRATGDPSWLWAGKDFVGSLQAFCRTECGYAGVRDVEDCTLDDQMPSFYLSETLKYLYLLFDEWPRSSSQINFNSNAGSDSSSDSKPESNLEFSSVLNFESSSESNLEPNTVSNSESNSGSNLESTLDSIAESNLKFGSESNSEPNPGGGGDGSRDVTWAEGRVVAGEGFRVGPDGWRGKNVLLWIEMYMDRTCPVQAAWWLAPHRYTPTTFVDTLTVGGRLAWVSLFANQAETMPGTEEIDGRQPQEVARQAVLLDGVGLIEVALDGNNFVLYHRESGEGLRISQAFSEEGGPGVPGAEDAGPMHIVSFGRQYGVSGQEDERERQEKTENVEEDGARHRQRERRNVKMRNAEKKNIERGRPTRRGAVGVPQERDTEGGPDSGLGVEVPQERDTEEGSDPLLSSESESESESSASSTSRRRDSGKWQPSSARRRTPSGGVENKDVSALAVSYMRTVLVTKEGLTVYCTLYLAEKGYPCSVATFSPQGEGTAIIPPLLAPVQLLETLGSPPGENRFGCQPPATEDMAIPHGAANDAPQDWLVEATVAGADEAQGSSRSKSESGGNIESGKMSEAGADDGSDAAVVLGVDGESVRRGEAGGEEEDDDDIFAALAHVSVTRGSPVEDGKRTGGDSDGVSRWAAEGTDYFLRGGKVGNGEGGQDRSEMILGAIAVVDRGECTFEQKAIIAQAEGAVALVVVNNEPGGQTFAMPGGGSDLEDGILGGVDIPVIMVGMEHGAEIREALIDAEAVGGLPQTVGGVLDIRTLHPSLFSKLAGELRSGKRDSWGLLITEEDGAGAAAATASIGGGNTAGSSRAHVEDSAVGVGRSSSPAASASTMGGMRPPPFSLPRVIVDNDRVQVVGVGRRGVVVLDREGSWARTLVVEH
eukprot:jgi/Undpi1/8771/HiC_scaffold_25.g11233.m1